MRRKLRLGSEQYIILRWREPIEEGFTEVTGIQDRNAALSLLRRLAGEPTNAPVLYAVAYGELPRPSVRDSQDRALQEVASKLAREQIKLARRVAYHVDVAGEKKAEEAAAPAAQDAPKKTWIRLKVVDDKTGEPIPDVMLKVTLPDDTEQEAKTDGAGQVRFDGIRPGTCSATSPHKGAVWDEVLPFAEMGRLPSSASPPAQSGQSKPAGASAVDARGPFKILHVDTHDLGDDETLDEVAASNGLSFDELATFNWETTDRDEIEELLEDLEADPDDGEVHAVEDSVADGFLAALSDGAEEEADDEAGKVFLPDDDEEPAADDEDDGYTGCLCRVVRRVHVPKPWTASGLATGQTHTVRVEGPEDTLTYLSLVLYDDDWSAPIAGARYQVSSLDGGLLYQGQTDDEGFLEHMDVPLGHYELKVKDVTLEMPDSVTEGETSGVGEVKVTVPAVTAPFRRHRQRVPYVVADVPNYEETLPGFIDNLV